MITAFRREMNPQVERLIAEGADAVHYKPFDVPQLLSTAERSAGAAPWSSWA
jgi:hypothetical protein